MRTTKLLLLFIIIVFFSNFSTAQILQSKIQVVGNASIMTIPENYEINIKIIARDTSYVNCSNELILRVNNLTIKMNEIGISSAMLKSSGFSIEEDFYHDRTTGKREKVGFVGAVTIQMVDKYNSETLGKIINVLMSNNFYYNLNFKLSEGQKKELTAKAIELSVEDARQKAELIAKYSGVYLGKILMITYDYININSDRLMMYAYDQNHVSYSVAENLTLTPKELSIEKKVLIEWSIKQKKKILT